MKTYTAEQIASWNSGEQKQLEISMVAPPVIPCYVGNESIKSESLSLVRSLCDESSLKFGRVSAAKLEFKGKFDGLPATPKQMCYIYPSLKNNENYSVKLGTFQAYSDSYTEDRIYRDVVAYDGIYWVGKINVYDWYDSLDFGDSGLTLKQIRDSFFAWVRTNHGEIQSFLGQNEATLPNDDIVIVKSDSVPTTLTGLNVLEAICELNGCFGIMDENGYFKYVFLEENTTALLPAETLYPSDSLYASNGASQEINTYTQGSLKYEEFTCQKITKVSIGFSSSNVPVAAGEDGNTYSISDNIFTYGMDTDVVSTVATNLLAVLGKAPAYVPMQFTTRLKPWLELGDNVDVYTRDGSIVSCPILQESISGITGCYDTISAEGEEYYDDNTSSLQSQIDSKVNRGGEVVNEVSNDSYGTVILRGNRLVVESDNFKVDADGSAEMKNVTLHAGEDTAINIDQDTDFHIGVYGINAYTADEATPTMEFKTSSGVEVGKIVHFWDKDDDGSTEDEGAIALLSNGEMILKSKCFMRLVSEDNTVILGNEIDGAMGQEDYGIEVSGFGSHKIYNGDMLLQGGNDADLNPAYGGNLLLTGNIYLGTTLDGNTNKLFYTLGDDLPLTGVNGDAFLSGGQKTLRITVPTPPILGVSKSQVHFETLKVVLRHPSGGGYPYMRYGDGTSYVGFGDGVALIDDSSYGYTNACTVSISYMNPGSITFDVTFNYALVSESGGTTAVTNNVPMSAFMNIKFKFINAVG